MLKHALTALLMIGCLSYAGATRADVLSPYIAVYEVSHGSIMLGDSTFMLVHFPALGEDCYQLQGFADPMGLAALLTSPIHELSRFCVENGRLQSRYYRIARKGGDRDENYSLMFDWGNHQVTTNGEKPRSLPTEGLDRMVMELKMRRLLEKNGGAVPDEPYVFLQVEDDEIKPFAMQKAKNEVMTTPAGRFDTILMHRVNDPKREMRFWLAPKLDYLPVRVEFQKKGKTKNSFVLRSFKRLPEDTTVKTAPPMPGDKQ